MKNEIIFENALKDGASYTIGYLIDEGFDINKCYQFTIGNQELSPLHLLSKLDIPIEQLKQTTRFLISRGANVNITNLDRKTPLHQAAVSNCIELAKVLIAGHANLELADVGGMTVLHYAAQYGREEFIDLILGGKSNELRNKLLNQASEDGKTAIHWAAFQNNPAVMRKILFYGAEPNQTQEHGFTALHYCARQGHLACAKVLIDAGANPRLVNRNKATALTIAQGGTDQELIDYLTKAEQHQLSRIGFGSHRRSRATTVIKDFDPGKVNSEFFTENDKQLIVMEQTRERRNFNIHDKEYTDERANQLGQVVEELALTLEQRKLKDQKAATTSSSSSTSTSQSVVDKETEIIESLFNEAIMQRKLLNYFEQNPNLLLFFNTIQVKLEEVLIGFKSVASGVVVGANSSNAEKVMTGISLLGTIVEMVPAAGSAVSFALSAAEGFVKSYDTQQQNNKAKLNSLTLGTLKNFDAINFKVAANLTLMFSAQILALAQAPHRSSSSNEIAIDQLPSVQFAEFIVLRILDALQNSEIQTKAGSPSLERQMINTVIIGSLEQSRWQRFKVRFEKLITHAIATNPTIVKGAWYLEDLLTKTAIITMLPDNTIRYFLPTSADPDTYFYRLLPTDLDQLKIVPISRSVVPVTHVDYPMILNLFSGSIGTNKQKSSAIGSFPAFFKASSTQYPSDEIENIRSRLTRIEQAVFSNKDSSGDSHLRPPTLQRAARSPKITK